ncbi:MAG: sulfatase-like hydrolase/transferase, partial [Akkermansiaceae bacterium]|nr:sulfatase-like hydrolase/transferase [Akkermansiaceae bacterium]
MDRRYALISSCSWRCRSFLGPPFYSPSPAPTRRPNIVMILIDDIGWGDFSCFGNKDAKAPNIHRLAAEGLRFEQFY